MWDTSPKEVALRHLGNAQNNPGFCYCSYLPTWTHWYEDTTCIVHRTWRNQSVTNHKACSLLLACSHSTRGCFAGCCGGSGGGGGGTGGHHLIQLWSLWTITMNSMVKNAYGCTSDNSVTWVTNFFLSDFGASIFLVLQIQPRNNDWVDFNALGKLMTIILLNGHDIKLPSKFFKYCMKTLEYGICSVITANTWRGRRYALPLCTRGSFYMLQEALHGVKLIISVQGEKCVEVSLIPLSQFLYSVVCLWSFIYSFIHFPLSPHTIKQRLPGSKLREHVFQILPMQAISRRSVLFIRQFFFLAAGAT